MRKFLLIISLILTFLGVYISWRFFNLLSIEYTYNGNYSIQMDKTGQVGDFIGGIVGTIFSLSGFILLLLTLHNQSQSAYIEQFENKFFELLRLHRDNVNEIRIRRKELENGEFIDFEYEKRRAFKQILEDFIDCRNDIKPLFNKETIENIYEAAFLKKISSYFNVSENDKKLKSFARINIAYCIVFFGVEVEGSLVIKKLTQKRFKTQFIDDIIKYTQMKPINSSAYWEKWKKLKKIVNFESRFIIINQILEDRNSRPTLSSLTDTSPRALLFYKNDYIKFYGGHQHRLGHYFRHLFQTVKFVNSQKKLSNSQKYFYVKTLRAQLSTYEQAILFINSLSIMGMAWEISPDYKKSRIKFIDSYRKKQFQLITKYNLIKNLPGEHIFGIKYKNYYPNVNYEIDNEV